MEAEKFHGLICHLRAKDTGKPGTQFIPSLKAWEPGVRCCKSHSERRSPKTRKSEVQRQVKTCLSSSREGIFTLPPPSIRPPKHWDSRLHWWRWSSLLQSTIQMLTSSGNTCTDTCRIHVFPAIWASLSLVKLTHKMNHRRDWPTLRINNWPNAVEIRSGGAWTWVQGVWLESMPSRPFRYTRMAKPACREFLQTKLNWHTAMPTDLHLFSDCFCTTTAGLRSYNGDH